MQKLGKWKDFRERRKKVIDAYIKVKKNQKLIKRLLKYIVRNICINKMYEEY